MKDRDHRQEAVATWCAAAFGVDHAKSISSGCVAPDASNG